MRAALVALVLLTPLTACDKGVDVEGLERRTELLEQQQREAAKSNTELAEQLAAANAEAAARDEERTKELAEVDRRLTELQGMISDLDQKMDEPPKPAVKPGRPDPEARYRVDVGDSQVRGPANAKITIVVFSDFQCPFCKRVQTTLKEVEREYGSDVRFVAKHNPLAFHHEAMAAAIAAEAAGKQGKFWEMHELLYENSRDLTSKKFTKWAKSVGCKASQFERDLEDRSITDRIKDDQALSAKVGARGVPAFYVNGRFLSGAQPFTAFKTLIDEEMKEADKLIASGTPQSGVYDALMRTAKSGV